MPNQIQHPFADTDAIGTVEMCKLFDVSTKTLGVMITNKSIPEPAIKQRGRGGNKWRYAQVKPIIEQQCAS